MVDLGGLGLRATSILTGDGMNRILVYSWYQGVASVGREILYALLALDQSPFRRTETALVVRVSTPVAPTSQGVKQAEKRLLEFLADIKIAKLNSSAPKKKGPNTRFGP